MGCRCDSVCVVGGISAVGEVTSSEVIEAETEQSRVAVVGGVCAVFRILPLKGAGAGTEIGDAPHVSEAVQQGVRGVEWFEVEDELLSAAVGVLSSVLCRASGGR